MPRPFFLSMNTFQGYEKRLWFFVWFFVVGFLCVCVCAFGVFLKIFWGLEHFFQLPEVRDQLATSGQLSKLVLSFVFFTKTKII